MSKRGVNQEARRGKSRPSRSGVGPLNDSLNGKWRGCTRVPNGLFRVFAEMVSGLFHELQMGSRMKENGLWILTGEAKKERKAG